MNAIIAAIITIFLQLSTVFGAIDCILPSNAYSNVVRWDFEYLMETPSASSDDIGDAFLAAVSQLSSNDYASLSLVKNTGSYFPIVTGTLFDQTRLTLPVPDNPSFGAQSITLTQYSSLPSSANKATFLTFENISGNFEQYAYQVSRCGDPSPSLNAQAQLNTVADNAAASSISLSPKYDTDEKLLDLIWGEGSPTSSIAERKKGIYRDWTGPLIITLSPSGEDAGGFFMDIVYSTLSEAEASSTDVDNTSRIIYVTMFLQGNATSSDEKGNTYPEGVEMFNKLLNNFDTELQTKVAPSSSPPVSSPPISTSPTNGDTAIQVGTAAPPPSSDDDSSSSSSLSIGAIIGIAVGGIALIALVAVLGYWYKLHKNDANNSQNTIPGNGNGNAMTGLPPTLPSYAPPPPGIMSNMSYTYSANADNNDNIASIASTQYQHAHHPPMSPLNSVVPQGQPGPAGGYL